MRNYDPDPGMETKWWHIVLFFAIPLGLVWMTFGCIGGLTC